MNRQEYVTLGIKMCFIQLFISLYISSVWLYNNWLMYIVCYYQTFAEFLILWDFAGDIIFMKSFLNSGSFSLLTYRIKKLRMNRIRFRLNYSTAAESNELDCDGQSRIFSCFTVSWARKLHFLGSNDSHLHKIKNARRTKRRLGHFA